MPQQAGDLQAHLSTLVANGGGDNPESGLECVNAALNGAWLKQGDAIPGGVGVSIAQIFPMVALWTDVDAQPPSMPWALNNANYPSAQDMPRDYAGLLAKWQDPGRIDQDNKLLVTFMPGASTPVWDHLRQWQGHFDGGTLQQGNTQTASRIADAIATLPSVTSPTLIE